jgi:hypothetical protein
MQLKCPHLGAVDVESLPGQGNLVEFVTNRLHSSTEHSELWLVGHGELHLMLLDEVVCRFSTTTPNDSN